MKGKIRYGNSIIRYDIIKSARRKTSEIIVDKKGIVIRVPQNKSMFEIQKIVKEKGRWMFKKQLEFRERKSERYVSKKYTKKFLITRINYYASKVGVYPEKINIKKLQSRWGSATKDNVITLNEYLLKAPKGAIDYVILHEICHLKIRNHSHCFWELLQKFMPNYVKNKRWLEANSTRIVE